jgi:uncharacterized coiled-coil protein SlyX
MPSSKSSERFDDLFQRFIELTQRLRALDRTVATHWRSIRTVAYRAAEAFVKMQRDHHDRFRAQMKSFEGDFDMLVDQLFGPLALWHGEDPRALIAAISKGLTLKDWMAQTARSYCDQKRSQKTAERVSAAEAACVTPTPGENLSVEAQNAQLRAALTERDDLIKELRKEVNALKTENERMRHDLKVVLRRLERMSADMKIA